MSEIGEHPTIVIHIIISEDAVTLRRPAHLA